ncbi:50S ribosomal protein L15 [Candidatus Berkelbacteria bacterium]|nr:50S ribosomal protein L15 [Candidatus Berkelbacteria bacterium]
MAFLHNLKQVSNRAKRRGRGIAAGQGKTGGRGTKGQKARTGANIPTGFEGGQSRLYIRLPKRRGEGFSPRFDRAAITLEKLDQVYQVGERVSVRTLKNKGLIKPKIISVKIIKRGQLTKSLKFSGVRFTQSIHQQFK